jgi:hypothetical protein
MIEIREITTWFTRGGWTTAHNLELDATMGAERYFRTLCGRDYPLVEPAFDEPTQAPDDMPRCLVCLRIAP